MDFWSRLIGGSGPRTSRAKSTTERLSAFKKTCNSLDQIYRKASHVSPSAAAAAGSSQPPIITFHFDASLLHHIRTSLQRLNDLLSDESKGLSPHPCHAQAISPYRIHATATRLAIQTHDAGIIAETATLFNVLIENETEVELVGNPDGESRRGSQPGGEGEGEDGGGARRGWHGRGEQGSVIYDADFASTLIDLVSKGAAICGEENEVRLVELLFCVANMIRSRPSILKTWFHPNRTQWLLDRETAEMSEAGDADEEYDQVGNKGVERQFAGATRKNDFPLFYLLINYVHHSGRPGDFARTAVLYIIETASHSKILERWLVESDLSTLMATGLGALYSQLSRKLPFTSPQALRQQQEKNDNKGSERQLAILDKMNPDDDLLSTCVHAQDSGLSSLAQGKDMDAFLSYLLFWQDTIEHCRSAEVNETLLEHFQVLFLQQLLYPSLLESSDVDGGSTSTVLTYLTRILESLNQPDLVHRILHFLLASPVVEFEKARVEASQAKNQRSPGPDKGSVKFRKPPQHNKKLSISRRMSIARLSPFISPAPSEVSYPVPSNQTQSPARSPSSSASDSSPTSSPSPALFNLVDIAIMGLRSKNVATVTATLRLISVIVNHHHVFAGDLIKTLPSDQTNKSSSGHQRSIGALNAEISHFIALAEVIVRGPGLDNVYENYLNDAKDALGVHRMESFVDYHNTPALMQALSTPETPETHLHNPTSASHKPLLRPRIIDPSDPLLSGIAHLLTSFFINSITLNLSLTSAIRSLVSSNLLSLDGWLLVEPQNYKFSGIKGESAPNPKSSTRENDDDNDDNDNDDDDDDDDDDQLLTGSIFDDTVERKIKRTIRQLKRAYIQPHWSRKDVPFITAVIRALVKQVDKWRVEVPEWDALMAKRKSVLMDPKPSEPSGKEAKRRVRVGSKGERRLRTPSHASSSRPASAARSVTPPMEATPPLTPSSSSRPHSPQGRRTASSSLRNAPLHMAESRVASSSSSSMSTTNDGGSNDVLTNAVGPTVDKLRNFSSSSLRLRTASGTTVRSRSSVKTVSASEEELIALKEEQKKEEMKRMMTMMFPVGRIRTSEKMDENTVTPASDDLEMEKEPRADKRDVSSNDRDSDHPSERSTNRANKATLSSSSEASKDDDDETQLVPLSHLLTNATLLHEFILELTALVQSRATLFQEVAFS